jgi:short subunit dehydrogenase-like uncharacterized protein
MAGRVVLLGATGYTGRLTAQALADRGAKPVLAGRDPARLAPLAERLGGLETARVDVNDAAAVRALVEPDDVLVTTVGPFIRLGEPAVRAAVQAGATYLDSTGEPPFIRRVFTEFGPQAQRSGAALFTAFGYDFVPGNLAGALALRDAGPSATAVAVGYFISGGERVGSGRRPEGGAGGFSMVSRGTARSVAEMLGEPSFALRGGQLRTERSGLRLGSFDLAAGRRDGISVGGSEHFTLGRVHDGLSDVDVYLGWFGRRSRLVHRSSRLLAPLLRVGPVTRGLRAAGRAAASRGRDPEPGQNQGLRTTVAAVAKDAAGRVLARVELDGPEPYLLTAELLAWGATTAQAGGVRGTGALGPADGFGLDELTAACAELGLRQADGG